MNNYIIPFLFLSITLLASCKSQLAEADRSSSKPSAVSATGPDAIIYKTRGDYNNLVPVILNEDKTRIVSFPAPGDLKYKGKDAVPTPLEDGFLLDNRGITANVAFLSVSYSEYMAMEKTPSAEELIELIIDNDPLIVMYNCGKRNTFKDEVNELNAHILDNDFAKFIKLR